MKSRIILTAVFCLGSAISSATAYAIPNVCFISISKNAHGIDPMYYTSISCDGESEKTLPPIDARFTTSTINKEISGQLAKLVSSGMRIVSCEVVPDAGTTTYSCTVSK